MPPSPIAIANLTTKNSADDTFHQTLESYLMNRDFKYDKDDKGNPS